MSWSTPLPAAGLGLLLPSLGGGLVGRLGGGLSASSSEGVVEAIAAPLLEASVAVTSAPPSVAPAQRRDVATDVGNAGGGGGGGGGKRTLTTKNGKLLTEEQKDRIRAKNRR